MRGICTRNGKSAIPMKLILAVITAVWLVSGLVYGQVLYGSIVGNVVDQNKATVPGATVSITNKATGQVRETITNNEGEYSITNILPG
ncbi:MAG: carboxypeptidase-like regulatory domain-containing protein [Acidobacteria bacterium]|nr:carboxypeptidase-like regulatory domain-containing protein [Acidobacteriota bacterium]